MKELGITTGQYSDVSDAELDSIITNIGEKFSQQWDHYDVGAL